MHGNFGACQCITILFYFPFLSFLTFNIAWSGNASTVQHKAGGGPGGVPALSILQNSGTQGRPATSGSSREQSDDDDEVEGDAETNDNIDVTDIKRMRR